MLRLEHRQRLVDETHLHISFADFEHRHLQRVVGWDISAVFVVFFGFFFLVFFVVNLHS
jgi:hypothetical protein